MKPKLEAQVPIYKTKTAVIADSYLKALQTELKHKTIELKTGFSSLTSRINGKVEETQAH